MKQRSASAIPHFSGVPWSRPSSDVSFKVVLHLIRIQGPEIYLFWEIQLSWKNFTLDWNLTQLPPFKAPWSRPRQDAPFKVVLHLISDLKGNFYEKISFPEKISL